MKKIHQNIQFEERKIIERLLKRGLSLRGIGKSMERSHSVIKYEIDNHSGILGYNAERAQGVYEKKQMNKGKVKKIPSNKRLETYILEKLKAGWSPELIALRLKKVPEEKEKAGGYISHETIYAYIYSQEMKPEKLWKYLVAHRPKRQKKGNRRSRKGGNLKNIVSIHKRPKIVESKKQEGHWESDSIQFSKQKDILSVQSERKYRLVRISKCPDKTAKETKKAIIDKLGGENADCLRTITFDRGTEGALHEKIAEELKIQIYFCDPYCSWQKGLVENRNKLIRYFFPRGIKISEITDEEVYKVQEKINNRPMKCLGGRTPNEMLFYDKYSRFPPLQWNGA